MPTPGSVQLAVCKTLACGKDTHANERQVLGADGPKNIALGIMNLTDAAHLGSDVAAYRLGEAFFRGWCDLPKDHVQARFWLRKVSECKFKHLSDIGLAKMAEYLREMDDGAGD